MRLHVRHATHFEYDTALVYAVQRFLLTPLSFASQRVESWKITAPGMEKALAYNDGFGNKVHLASLTNHEGPMDVVAEGIVECKDAQGLVKGIAETAPRAVYLRQTSATAPSEAMLTLATPVAAKDTLPFLHKLLNQIHENVEYQLGTTDNQTTAAQAFANGNGVCQDHTHIFIGITRALQLPSRYVTGYLVTGIGASSTAAHAWAEIFVPDLGWVGFDAANGICPTDNYVRVASGIDAASVTPIRGSRRGGVSETMTVEVIVEIAQQ
ncbi:MAG: transglutaminase family protein [Pseudomonadota bacterium]|nr:transglutaminase family protein [Pseudomonadota bacterium]